MSVQDARAVGERARQAVETVHDVVKAEVHLFLSTSEAQVEAKGDASRKSFSRVLVSSPKRELV